MLTYHLLRPLWLFYRDVNTRAVVIVAEMQPGSWAWALTVVVRLGRWGWTEGVALGVLVVVGGWAALVRAGGLVRVEVKGELGAMGAGREGAGGLGAVGWEEVVMVRVVGDWEGVMGRVVMDWVEAGMATVVAVGKERAVVGWAVVGGSARAVVAREGLGVAGWTRGGE